MNVKLFASVSVNGKVLLAENPNHQVPQEILGEFMQMVNKAGNLILGRKTFDIMAKYPAAIQALSGVDMVILSEHKTDGENYKVASSPEKAIEYFKQKGCSEIVIGGGTQVYNAFLKGDFVSELYLNLIPIISGSGGVIGLNEDLLIGLKPGNQKNVGDIIQLHYTKI
ncbi:dihydrofolate reductase family protein [Sporocytophaga myxococcoides]|uniref:dihydrofolate reductase family protein n=1 Tax=Sporocytophaga myxococcoides TaxID=153721 RepID=UPI00040AF930|nr:dihydrofolate reductase [Sporocytophaga myxococcoides]